MSEDTGCGRHEDSTYDADVNEDIVLIAERA